MNALLQQPFIQITLPLMVTFIATMWIAQWSQNKRFDDLKELLRAEIVRLGAEMKGEFATTRTEIKALSDRVARLESPIVRR